MTPRAFFDVPIIFFVSIILLPCHTLKNLPSITCVFRRGRNGPDDVGTQVRFGFAFSAVVFPAVVWRRIR